MERELAELVVKSIEKKNGPTLTISEAMAMTKIPTDGINVYAIQKGYFTFIAWIYDPHISWVRTQVVSW